MKTKIHIYDSASDMIINVLPEEKKVFETLITEIWPSEVGITSIFLYTILRQSKHKY